MPDRDESRKMLTRKLIKSDDSNQIVDKISQKRIKRESSNTTNKLTARMTGRQLKGYEFQTNTKINMTSLLLTSKLVLKKMQGKRMFNATMKAQSSETRQNVSVINRFIIKDISNRSVAQLNSKALNNVKDSTVSSERPILRRYRSPGRNPCVKRMKLTYYSSVKRIFPEFKCHRASFFCSSKLGSLGRCMPLKKFYPSIDKILTTGCKCKERLKRRCLP